MRQVRTSLVGDQLVYGLLTPKNYAVTVYLNICLWRREFLNGDSSCHLSFFNPIPSPIVFGSVWRQFAVAKAGLLV